MTGLPRKGYPSMYEDYIRKLCGLLFGLNVETGGMIMLCFEDCSYDYKTSGEQGAGFVISMVRT